MSGLAILHAIQSISNPFLDRFFKLFTDLHQINVYIVLLPLFLWYYDKRFARYLISVLILGYWANGALKDYFHTPRPSPDQVRVLWPETGTGPAFPSGHAMNPVMFYGAIAMRVQKTWLTVVLGVLCFLIGFSRLYAGLHWPLDVVGGWALGLAALALFEWSRAFWVGEGRPLGYNLLWSFLVPVITLAISLWALHDLKAFNFSPAGQAGEGWMLSGAYMGLLMGAFLEEEAVGFEPRVGTAITQFLKLLIGFALVLGVKEGLKPLLPDTALFLMVRYFAVGISVSLVAPWLFRWLPGYDRLARR